MRHLQIQNSKRSIEKIKNRFFVLDTETKKGKHNTALEPLKENFVFGVLYGIDTQVIFNTHEEFLKEINKAKYYNTYIFAHNAEFDLLVLFGNIYKFLDHSAVFNGKFISAKYKKITFADSLNIFPASVEKIGETVGMNKIVNEKVKESGLTKENKTEKDVEYCIRDCEIVFTALLKIFEYVGTIKLTLSSLSLYNFRNKFLAENIVFSDLVDEFYESYYGGRTEVFKLGKCNCKVADVNSLYPYVMSYMRFPDVRTLKKETLVDLKYFNYILKNYEGCAKITIEHKETYFGFLPYKSDNLLFPVGVFTGVWNFNEIRFALQSDVIIILSVEYVIYANPVKTPFKEFIEYHYDQRMKTTNELDKLIEKLIPNSLYGRFAMRMKYQTTYYEDIPYELMEELNKTDKFYSLKTFSEKRDDCFLITDNEKFKNSFFAIPTYSSYITSEARIVLLKALIQNEKNRPLYCDTDSIFFEGEFEGTINKDLGSFKIEEKIVTEIRGLKNYVYSDDTGVHETIKGVSKRSKKIGENKYVTQKYFKTKESLRRGTEAGESFEQIKILSHVYNKRIVDKSNGETKPIKLPLPEIINVKKTVSKNYEPSTYYEAILTFFVSGGKVKRSDVVSYITGKSKEINFYNMIMSKTGTSMDSFNDHVSELLASDNPINEFIEVLTKFYTVNQMKKELNRIRETQYDSSIENNKAPQYDFPF